MVSRTGAFLSIEFPQDIIEITVTEKGPNRARRLFMIRTLAAPLLKCDMRICALNIRTIASKPLHCLINKAALQIFLFCGLRFMAGMAVAAHKQWPSHSVSSDHDTLSWHDKDASRSRPLTIRSLRQFHHGSYHATYAR
nr:MULTISPECIES: hypothetical protein [Thalassospira]